MSDRNLYLENKHRASGDILATLENLREWRRVLLLGLAEAA